MRWARKTGGAAEEREEEGQRALASRVAEEGRRPPGGCRGPGAWTREGRPLGCGVWSEWTAGIERCRSLVGGLARVSRKQNVCNLTMTVYKKMEETTVHKNVSWLFF